MNKIMSHKELDAQIAKSRKTYAETVRGMGLYDVCIEGVRLDSLTRLEELVNKHAKEPYCGGGVSFELSNGGKRLGVAFDGDNGEYFFLDENDELIGDENTAIKQIHKLSELCGAIEVDGAIFKLQIPMAA